MYFVLCIKIGVLYVLGLKQRVFYMILLFNFRIDPVAPSHDFSIVSKVILFQGFDECCEDSWSENDKCSTHR